ncbi:MAG: ornithine carbamoyltransferase [Candidatus Diapherotrites archaeon]
MLKGKDLLTLIDYSPKEIKEIIDLGIKVKKNPKKYQNALKQKTLAMLFMKTSTRTRLSFEAGMTQLGGHAIYLDWRTTNLTKGRLEEEIRCIDRYVDIIMARVYKHEEIQAIAKAADKPVINALCDLFHPCQALADFMTIIEKKKRAKGLKVAFVGDGNNVCNSLTVCGAKLGAKIAIGTPKGYEPLQRAIEEAKRHSEVMLYNSAQDAVRDADVVYTDTWVSMGQEEETEKRLKVFPAFQVNSGLMALAKKDALFMHCLPAHVGQEVTEDVLYSKNSVVFDQAENRMHVQKALMLKLLGKA